MYNLKYDNLKSEYLSSPSNSLLDLSEGFDFEWQGVVDTREGTNRACYFSKGNIATSNDTGYKLYTFSDGRIFFYFKSSESLSWYAASDIAYNGEHYLNIKIYELNGVVKMLINDILQSTVGEFYPNETYSNAVDFEIGRNGSFFMNGISNFVRINDQILINTLGTGTTITGSEATVMTLHSDDNVEYMHSYVIEEAPSTTAIDLRNATNGQGRITQNPAIDHAIGDTAKMWVQLRDTDVTPLETLIQSTDLVNSVQIDRDNDVFVLTGYTVTIVDTDDNVLTLPSEMVDKTCLVTMTATTATDVKYVGNDDTESTVIRGFIYDYKIKTIYFAIDELTGDTLNADGTKPELGIIDNFSEDIWGENISIRSVKKGMVRARAIGIPFNRNIIDTFFLPTGYVVVVQDGVTVVQDGKVVIQLI